MFLRVVEIKRPGLGNLYPFILLASSLIRLGSLSTDCSATTHASIDGGMQESIGSRNLSRPTSGCCAPSLRGNRFGPSIQCLIQDVNYSAVVISLQGNSRSRPFSV